MSNRKQTRIEINSSALMPKNPPGGTADANCVPCQTRVQMLTPEQASAFTGIASQTIYRWIEDNQVHSHKSGEGRLLICLNSLRETYADSIKETKKVRAIDRSLLSKGVGKE
jgi:excisionase family DNA binding protein